MNPNPLPMYPFLPPAWQNLEKAIIPYYNLSPDYALLVLQGIDRVRKLEVKESQLSSVDSMGNMKNLPLELILEIFIRLPSRDTYKLSNDYKMTALLKLSQGKPVFIEDISEPRFLTLAREVSELSLCCKTFYVHTAIFRDLLQSSQLYASRKTRWEARLRPIESEKKAQEFQIKVLQNHIEYLEKKQSEKGLAKLPSQNSVKAIVRTSPLLETYKDLLLVANDESDRKIKELTEIVSDLEKQLGGKE